MLVISRKVGESLVVGSSVIISIVEVRGDKVRLGVEAPSNISVHRKEVFDDIKKSPGSAKRHIGGLESEQQADSK